MTELKDIAKENDVDLENCVVFVRGNDDILAVDISNAGIDKEVMIQWDSHFQFLQNKH